MTAPLDPQRARELLEQADSAGATARAGASWPHIAGLLGMGAASSLALVALAYVPPVMIWLPMALLFAWIGALLAFGGVFGRSIKRGFGHRWRVTMLVWGIVWVAGVVGTSWLFAGQAWFVVVASVALTAVTLVGAWVEASR
ncbi:hypothetical protein G7070_05145 [Propioniciclava coleopterorum]|uniref:Uncharacterized protein n=1 Tax=Propioniciclava coleopterorum TaxID=2714937 RepID=A0A6G7Y4M2_9ACTN|nr:hypothetical protein [Propioniciclava coleopterorum]QIK71770.1 hypothetical protein G7070_05145 [Propioniciclava coleopterorum]